MLLEKGANPNALGESGNSALLVAVKRLEVDMVNSLLEKGADPNKLIKMEILSL